MPGVLELAEEVFRIPVRLGVPHHVTGLNDVVCNPIHATGVGLLLYSLQQQGEVGSNQTIQPLASDRASVWDRMKGWFSRHF